MVLLAIVPARERERERERDREGEGERGRWCVLCCIVRKSSKPGTFVATGLLALAVTLEVCMKHLKLVNFPSECE